MKQPVLVLAEMLLGLFAVSAMAAAAAPPDLVNYQGVLRDSGGDPENGSFDMRFRFFDAAAGGQEILLDEHVAAGTGDVTVADGLFNVQLGSGGVTDGSGIFPGDPYDTMSEMFRDFGGVYVQIEIDPPPAGGGFEVLSPRVRVVSAAYSLSAGDADTLDGMESSEFIDTSASSQSKAGNLTVGKLDVNGDLTVAGSVMRMNSANGTIFLNSDAGPTDGPWISTNSVSFAIQAGDDDGDFLWLRAGNWLDDGNIIIDGDGPISMTSGDGFFSFRALNQTELAVLGPSGDLDLLGDLTASGGEVTLATSTGHVFLNSDATTAAGPFVRGNVDGTLIQAGDADADDLRLYAGNSFNDGRIIINGGGSMDLRAGNGNFSFQNGINFAEIADLSPSGDLQIDGDLIVTGTKNFLQNHPERVDQSIVYVALEGAEAATFARGSGRLDGGVAAVPLEETFAWTTNPEIGLTAHVTPRGEWGDLYVESVSTSQLVVRSRDGADTAFDYVVYGLRIGHEEFPVIRQRSEEARIPSAQMLDRKHPRRGEFREYTAAERFRRIDEVVFDGAATKRSNFGQPTAALRAAIGLNDGIDVVQERASEADPVDVGEPEDRAARSESPSIGGALTTGGDSNVHARAFRSGVTGVTSPVTVSEPVEAGDVLVADPGRQGRMALSRAGGDRAVIGVVADGPVVSGEGATDDPVATIDQGMAIEVAVAGVVRVKVDAGFGAIRTGDLLTTSPTEGHAMLAAEPLPGTILGKALEPLDAGTGLIRMLVMLR